MSDDPGKFVTFEKSGAVSFDTKGWLQTPTGRAQMLGLVEEDRIRNCRHERTMGSVELGGASWCVCQQCGKTLFDSRAARESPAAEL